MTFENAVFEQWTRLDKWVQADYGAIPGGTKLAFVFDYTVWDRLAVTLRREHRPADAAAVDRMAAELSLLAASTGGLKGLEFEEWCQYRRERVQAACLLLCALTCPPAEDGTEPTPEAPQPKSPVCGSPKRSKRGGSPRDQTKRRFITESLIAVELRNNEALTSVEIARVVGCSDSTVRRSMAWKSNNASRAKRMGVPRCDEHSEWRSARRNHREIEDLERFPADER